jgi:hypothetical protein
MYNIQFQKITNLTCFHEYTPFAESCVSTIKRCIFTATIQTFPFKKSATIKCQIAALKIVYNRVTAPSMHPILYTHVHTLNLDKNKRLNFLQRRVEIYFLVLSWDILKNSKRMWKKYLIHFFLQTNKSELHLKKLFHSLNIFASGYVKNIYRSFSFLYTHSHTHSHTHTHTYTPCLSISSVWLQPIVPTEQWLQKISL